MHHMISTGQHLSANPYAHIISRCHITMISEQDTVLSHCSIMWVMVFFCKYFILMHYAIKIASPYPEEYPFWSFKYRGSYAFIAEIKYLLMLPEEVFFYR